jgi:hypothetical protein
MVSREVAANGGRDQCRAWRAHQRAREHVTAQGWTGVKGCWSTYNALDPLIYDAGPERASSAAHDPFCDSCPMLRAKSSGRSDDGPCGCTESVNECPIIGRSVIGAFGDSGNNRNWTYSNRTNIRPELVRVLHALFPSPHRSHETAPCRSSVTASQAYGG